MPGCVRRASGDSFDVNSFLKKSVFKPYLTYQKGNFLSPSAKKRYKESGFNILVSEASGKDFKRQTSDAITFLQTYSRELRRLIGA